MKKKQFVNKSFNGLFEEKIVVKTITFHCGVVVAMKRGFLRDYGRWGLYRQKTNTYFGNNLHKGFSFAHQLLVEQPFVYKDSVEFHTFVGDFEYVKFEKQDNGCFLYGVDQADMRMDVELIDISNMIAETRLVFKNMDSIKLLRLRASQKEKMEENIKRGLWVFSKIDNVEVV